MCRLWKATSKLHAILWRHLSQNICGSVGICFVLGVHFNLGAERVVGAVCKRTPSVKLCGCKPRLRNLAPNVKYTLVLDSV
jgi:hypothetical protein